jgi:hypothetical protein
MGASKPAMFHGDNDDQPGDEMMKWFSCGLQMK